MPLLKPHWFSYENYGTPNRSLCTPVEIQQPIDHVSTLVEATFAGRESVPTFFPNAPDFGRKVVSEMQVLHNYLSGIRDLKQHLRELLHIQQDPEFFDCNINPLAVVLTLDGFAYARFTEEWNSRRLCPVSSASVGATLALEQLPRDLRGRVVLLNEGDGDTGHRSKEQIELTKRHELLHVIFNEFFARSEFITTPDLIGRLQQKSGISDPQSYQELVGNLLDSMFDRARSEIISYCACGELGVDPFKVDAHFWFDHIPAVVEYLNSQPFSEQQGNAILNLFVCAYEEYWRSADRYLNIALALPRENYGLSTESIAYLLVLDRHRLNYDHVSQIS